MIKLEVKRNIFFQLKDTLKVNYFNFSYFTVKITVMMKFSNFFYCGLVVVFHHFVHLLYISK